MRERGIGRFEAKISRVAIGGREVYAAEKKGQIPEPQRPGLIEATERPPVWPIRWAKFPGLSARASFHLESQRRQYGLADRARLLGWQDVEVIDDDLGRSAGGVRRPGFERLLAAICEGRVGAVMSVEASRLARNGRDWHTLLEFCGLVGTIIVDEDASKLNARSGSCRFGPSVRGNQVRLPKADGSSREPDFRRERSICFCLASRRGGSRLALADLVDREGFADAPQRQSPGARPVAASADETRRT